MGVDLVVYPLMLEDGLNGLPEWPNNRSVLGVTRFRLGRSRGLFRQIEGYGDELAPVVRVEKLPAECVLREYTDRGLENTRVDRYGEELTWASGKEMKKLQDHGESEWNKGILALIQAWPDDAVYIFMWS